MNDKQKRNTLRAISIILTVAMASIPVPKLLAKDRVDILDTSRRPVLIQTGEEKTKIKK